MPHAIDYKAFCLKLQLRNSHILSRGQIKEPRERIRAAAWSEFGLKT